jgi:hypothetical protein
MRELSMSSKNEVNCGSANGEVLEARRKRSREEDRGHSDCSGTPIKRLGCHFK